MNNKGQTLVLFIALIPFIFMIFVFAIDLAKLSAEKTYIEGIANEALVNLQNGNSISSTQDIILKNDKDIQIDSIDNNKVCLSKQIEPIFGGILGVDFFTAKYCAK